MFCLLNVDSNKQAVYPKFTSHPQLEVSYPLAKAWEGAESEQIASFLAKGGSVIDCTSPTFEGKRVFSIHCQVGKSIPKRREKSTQKKIEFLCKTWGKRKARKSQSVMNSYIKFVKRNPCETNPVWLYLSCGFSWQTKLVVHTVVFRDTTSCRPL